MSRAVSYYRRAAREAMAQTANDEAIELYRRAGCLLDASTASGDQRLLCELQVERGGAERRAGHASFRRTFLDATELAVELGASDLALRRCWGPVGASSPSWEASTTSASRSSSGRWRSCRRTTRRAGPACSPR